MIMKAAIVAAKILQLFSVFPRFFLFLLDLTTRPLGLDGCSNLTKCLQDMSCGTYITEDFNENTRYVPNRRCNWDEVQFVAALLSVSSMSSFVRCRSLVGYFRPLGLKEVGGGGQKQT